MKAHTFSIVVGDRRCNAECPYCIAKMTSSELIHVDFNKKKFKRACRIADQMRDGLMNVILTGLGEPLLAPQQITQYLGAMGRGFPRVDLQTNGILIEKNLENLELWQEMGLSLVCLSVAGTSDYLSNKAMGIKSNFDYWKTARMLKDIGLAVRLNCTMTKNGIYRTDDAMLILDRAANAGIDQVTFREVEMPYNVADDKVGEWVDANKARGAAVRLLHHLESRGAVRLLEMPHGGVVFDYGGQNVAIANCLTTSTDPNDIRQIIYFPDGHLQYDWRYKGALIV
jgi:molybdenum cofactor biosynthesis enzyme MoaA